MLFNKIFLFLHREEIYEELREKYIYIDRFYNSVNIVVNNYNRKKLTIIECENNLL